MKPDWEKPQKALRCSAHNWPCPSHKSRPGIHLREERAKYQVPVKLGKLPSCQNQVCPAGPLFSCQSKCFHTRPKSPKPQCSVFKYTQGTVYNGLYNLRWKVLVRSKPVLLVSRDLLQDNQNNKSGKSNDESGKAKVAVAGDYIKAGVRSDRLPFDSFCSVLQQQLSSLCTTMCQALQDFT